MGASPWRVASALRTGASLSGYLTRSTGESGESSPQRVESLIGNADGLSGLIAFRLPPSSERGGPQVRADHRHQSGRATGSVLLLLVMLSGAGAWNYHRNLQLEAETEGSRPFESYSSDDLATLRDAYQSELSGVRAKFADAKSQRVRPKANVGSISGNVDQFAQTTQTSKRIRKAASNVAEREGKITELERELDVRSRLGQGLMRHVKRLTTI
jgi:hypothetical protein